MEETAFYQGPGFRFHPTDEEIVRYYLKKKLTGNLPSCFDYLAVIDIYKFEPWDLPKLSKLKTRDLEWYFFTALDKKYGNSIRTNRATDRGYWKTTGKDRAIKNGEETVGMKKTLVYHSGRAPHGDRSNWVMHEYRMIDETLAKAGVQDAYVLCRIFEKSGSGPKNGEKYGAPFVEEEWESFGEQVLPLPPVDNEPLKLEGFTPDVDELVNPLAVSVPDDVLVDPLDVFYDELWNENLPDSTYEDFFEAHDLDQDLVTSNTVGSAELQSNFCYGECSTHPQYSQAFINERKQSEATLGVYEYEVDQPNNIADLYGGNINSVQDGYNGGTNHNENPLNFNFASEVDQPNNIADLYGGNINSVQDGYNGGTNHNENPLNFNFASEDLGQVFHAPDYITGVTDEYMETNDIAEMDPSVAAMLDGSLADPDDDISNYICFDSPLNARSESPIASYGQPIIEQNVEGETYDSSLTNKHVFEAQPSDEVLPKEDLAASNWVSGDANTFVKHLLANIPAPPAFASEFPAKELACEIHPAAESSNSAHITAGMISITDITFRGNAMDWMVGKNGGFNTVMSTGFSQTDVNPATLVPISGLVCSKTAFMLSHGWVFLMGFSVVILSLSFKIGSFMYTGK
ncbi:NAC transcription factor-like protein [Medicago truncatula]|uniref:NAC transcription factor-like protein n=1 Tax=Medicago truncatula TaxID=3880 RepID=A0A072VNB4_MEDTR|nr:NAC transcription factor-like protein [Medicago truncatula]